MSIKKTVYVFHKSGANSHYRALAYLLKNEGYVIKYREFSILNRIFKSIFKFDGKLFKKQLVNISFIIQLLFTKNKRVVIGIAPYDYKLVFIRFWLKNHKVYYHTSWTIWDGSVYPKKKFVTKRVMRVWKNFIENDIQHIFAVSNRTKSQLIENYTLSESKINVVFHSFDEHIFKYNSTSKTKKLSFLYVGRLVSEKGVLDLLEFFSENPQLTFKILGGGDLKEKVLEFSREYKNILYMGYTFDKKELVSIYNSCDYILLNSYKTKYWEELFGMVIIEGMACGMIPIATNHVGPSEVITDKKDGYLIEEGKIKEFLETIKANSIDETIKMNAIQTAKKYSISSISSRWKEVISQQ